MGNPRSQLALSLWLLPLSRAVAGADCPQRAVVFNGDATGTQRGVGCVREDSCAGPVLSRGLLGPSPSSQDTMEASPLPSGKASGPV